MSEFNYDYDYKKMEEKAAAKSAISSIGWALAAFTIFSELGGFLAIIILHVLGKGIINDPDARFLASTLPVYVIGFPIFLFIVKNLRKAKANYIKKISLKNFLMIILFSFGVMYISNMFSLIIDSLLRTFTRSGLNNPVSDMLSGGSIFLKIFFICFIGPIIEEVMFRKIIISRLVGYGEFIAVFVSAFMFAFGHGNLSQFFYAFSLGAIFAYITVKTGTIFYSVIIHCIINLIGSGLLLRLFSNNATLKAFSGGVFMFISIIFAIFMIVKNVKMVYFNSGNVSGTVNDDFRLIFKNSGMIFYIGLSVILILISLL
ncbi:type II CAAX endopeptidase family protein [Clostridium sp. BJN0001]|uniref:CPBP family intramembrane glutamic endopeptidase n=1 Tax=Clostridium sp. BJN0001 TaxID=2930219 RepID=UPI001FD00F49|nr:type II CAAX endopeptidase family protein [Clostridium sp. BJN0001]